MNIHLHCPGCNRELAFPRSAAGGQGRCPGCNHTVYIPTPADELRELPLASDDLTARMGDAAARAERRMLTRILAGADDPPKPESIRPASSTAAQSASAAPNIEQLIVGYLGAMRDSDLNGAEACLSRLRNQRADALDGIDRLAADQIPPAALQNLPPGVYQGFLRNLRSRL